MTDFAAWWKDWLSANAEQCSFTQVVLSSLVKLALPRSQATAHIDVKDPETVVLYAQRLFSARRDPKEIYAVYEDAISALRFFPSANELADAFASAASRRFPYCISDPVYVQLASGEPAVASRKTCQQTGRPFFDTEREALASLPARNEPKALKADG